ncbi:MAG: EthD family reductase [Nitriliruptorales bacterium]|nr:EthD family reductase [Nitriliruptorales bacterium]
MQSERPPDEAAPEGDVMARFVALYPKPDDVEAFDEYYRTTHLPIAKSWPGMTAYTVTRFSATPRGTEAPYYLMAVAEWQTDEEMAAALRSDAGVASARDAKMMASQFGVTPTMMLGDVF